MPRIADLPVAPSVDADNDVLVLEANADGESYKVTPAQVAATGSGPVWEWNGVDVSQFDTGNVWAEPGGRIGGMSIAVQANAEVPGGQELLIDGTGYAGGGDGWALLMINDPMPSWNLRIEMSVLDHDVNVFGLALFCDDSGSGQYAVLRPLVGAQVLGAFVENEALAVENLGVQQTLLGINQRGLVTVRIQGEKPASSVPRGLIYGVGWRDPSPASIDLNFNDIGARGAGWNPLAANRIGFCLYAAGGSTAGPTRINSIRIFDES